ncbi:MAG: hypothetical protein AAGH15_10400 [Myxococcota bacterium]
MSTPPQDVVPLGEGFWNLRGSFRIGPVDIGTHASLCRLESGRYVLLDAIRFSSAQESWLREMTEGGAALEAVLNVHPFHTVFCASAHRLFPDAAHHGTARHHRKLPEVPWAELRTEDEALHARYAADFAFSVPAGVDFIPANENLHFASVIALHRASRTIHVDDTFGVQKAPPFLRKPGNQLVSVHPTLPLVLEPTREAVPAFRDWGDLFVSLAGDADQLAAAHDGILRPRRGEPSVRDRVGKALATVEPLLRLHERRHR